MAATAFTFQDFIVNVFPPYQEAVTALNERLIKKGMAVEITQAKSGYVVSYKYQKRTVLNFVFRKSGLMMRLYAENLAKYDEKLQALPENLKKLIAKATVCKRLANTGRCSSNCPMGYVFALDGVEHKKCRYNAFLLPVNDTTMNELIDLADAEAEARCA